MAVMGTRIGSMNWQRRNDHPGTRWFINTGLDIPYREHGEKAIRNADGAISHEVIGTGLCFWVREFHVWDVNKRWQGLAWSVVERT